MAHAMAAVVQPQKANIRKHSDSSMKFSFIYSPLTADRPLRLMDLNSAILQGDEKYYEKWSDEIHNHDLRNLIGVFVDGGPST
jgi:hypothetical protein